MSHTRVNTNILITIALTALAPVILGRALNAFFPLAWTNIPLHSALEVSGGIIAIVISMIFYIKFKSTHTITHFNWATTALLSMGIIDIFHGSVMPGNMFVWLHSAAVFFGGIFFMSVWIREKQVPSRAYAIIPLFFVAFSVIFSTLSLICVEYVPAMLTPEGSFTKTANVLNIVGGLGFFVASARFLLLYKKTQDLQELLFAGHTMLFGIAGILFVSSVVWDLSWWLWHLLRLMAYAIALYFFYIEYRDEIALIEHSNTTLNLLNLQLSEYVNMIDKNVITSATDAKGVITAASQAFCDISGYSKEELIGKAHNIVRHPDTPAALYKAMWAQIMSGKSWQGELKNRKKDGSFYWVKTTIEPQFNSKGEITGYIAIRQDITDRKKVEELSITDALTGLRNRRFFNEMFQKELQRAKRHDTTLALIMIDIDHFKDYNDRYGHMAGDEALQQVGKTLRSHVQRASDYAFRIGGEEFALLLSAQAREELMAFAESIRESILALKIAHADNSAHEYLSVSIGIASEHGSALKDMQTLYMAADRALYRAKEEGRNRVVCR